MPRPRPPAHNTKHSKQGVAPGGEVVASSTSPIKARHAAPYGWRLCARVVTDWDALPGVHAVFRQGCDVGGFWRGKLQRIRRAADLGERRSPSRTPVRRDRVRGRSGGERPSWAPVSSGYRRTGRRTIRKAIAPLGRRDGCGPRDSSRPRAIPREPVLPASLGPPGRPEAEPRRSWRPAPQRRRTAPPCGRSTSGRDGWSSGRFSLSQVKPALRRLAMPGMVVAPPLLSRKTRAGAHPSQTPKWAQRDLNPRPSDYESAALTD